MAFGEQLVKKENCCVAGQLEAALFSATIHDDTDSHHGWNDRENSAK
jgi:hypothetical protein